MIGRKPHPNHPDDPNTSVFMPLGHDRQRDEWIPLVRHEGFYLDALDAGRVCLAAFHRAWTDISKAARLLRALCEHPGLAGFAVDGMDADMLADTARTLTARIEAANVNLSRLLDEPSEEDVIRIAGQRFHVNPDTAQLEPSEGAEHQHEQSADALFQRLISAALVRVPEATGEPVSERGIEGAIATLILCLPEKAERATAGTDTGQFVSDRMFSRLVASALHRASKRTGRPVSTRGIEDAIMLLEKLRSEQTEPANGNGIVTESIEDDVTPLGNRPDTAAKRTHERNGGDDEPDGSGGDA